MRVSLYTVAEGEDYAPFVKGWWESVQTVVPMPDEIVVVIGKDDHANARPIMDNDERVTLIELDEPFSNNFFTAGVEACTGDWISFCGIDDRMLPLAYNELSIADHQGAEIMVGTIVLSNGATWRGIWDPTALQHHNTLPAHSPFRKSLYDRVGGFPDIRWSDWGFWLKCARAGVNVHHSSQPIAIFDIGEGRETMSGVGLADDKRRAADKELQDFLATL